MLKIHSRSMDFSASSIVDEVAIASMHASYSGTSEMYINMNILDLDAYIANEAVVDADYAAFCDEVVAVIAHSKNEIVE